MWFNPQVRVLPGMEAAAADSGLAIFPFTHLHAVNEANHHHLHASHDPSEFYKSA